MTKGIRDVDLASVVRLKILKTEFKLLQIILFINITEKSTLYS